MGITKTADGRYQVGKGIADANNYTGALGKRDMVIQYTEDGVTAQSMEYLNFLKDYAEHHADIGELIKPSDVSIWIAKDDKLTAVEADDISYSDGTFTLSSITYDGTDWTFGEPTPGGGSGGGVPAPTSEDVGKVLTVAEDTEHTETVYIVPTQSFSIEFSGTPVILHDVNMSEFTLGSVVTMTLNGESAETTIVDDGGLIAECDIGETHCMIYQSDDGLQYSSIPAVAPSTTYTVSLTKSVFSATASWQSTFPTYTSEDEGKVLTIAPTLVDTVVVPEQTVTTVGTPGQATLDGVTIDWTSVQLGDELHATINGDEYTLSAVNNGGTIGFLYADNWQGPSVYYGLVNMGGSDILMTLTAGDYTVSMTQKNPGNPAPAWKMVPVVFLEFDEEDGEYTAIYSGSADVLIVPIGSNDFAPFSLRSTKAIRIDNGNTEVVTITYNGDKIILSQAGQPST